MAEPIALAVALIAVAAGWSARQYVPWLNVKGSDPQAKFDMRYLRWGLGVFVANLYAAYTGLDQLPDLFQASLGATFMGFFLWSLGSTHMVLEAIDKGAG